ncbi:MAG: AsnC family protein [Defluviitaleaceae bacterium]|nr:AsnC family protein [Defluviitaleaceae bacterium]
MEASKSVYKIDPAKVAELLKQDPKMSLRKMSAKLGVSTWGLSLWFRRHPGFDGYSVRPNSVMHDKVDKLHKLLAEDPTRTRRELARLLGVNIGTLSKWVYDHPEVKVVKEKRPVRVVDCSEWMPFEEVKKWALLELPLDYKSVAKAFGVSGSRVRRWLAARPDVRAWMWLEKDRRVLAKIEPLLAEDPNLSYVKLSSKLGVSTDRLRRLIPGRNVGKVSMTPEKIKLLGEALDAGPKRTCVELAKWLDVSSNALGKYLKKNPEMRRKWAKLWYGEAGSASERDAAVLKKLEQALREQPRRTWKELAAMVDLSPHTLDGLLRRNQWIRALKARKMPRKADDPEFMAMLKAELEKNPRASWSELAKTLGVTRTMVMCIVREYMGMVKPQARNPGRTP